MLKILLQKTLSPNPMEAPPFNIIIQKFPMVDFILFLKKKPWAFTGIDFNLDIPNCDFIKKIAFTIPMKINGTTNIKATNTRFNFYNGTKSFKTNINNYTGWDDGYYYYNPNKKLSNI